MNFESAVFLLIIWIIKIIEIIQINWKFIRKKTTFKDSSLSLLTKSCFKPKLNHWMTVLLYSSATFTVYLSVWIPGLPKNDQNHDKNTIIDITLSANNSRFWRVSAFTGHLFDFVFQKRVESEIMTSLIGGTLV